MAHIELDIESLAQSKLGTITGIVYWRFDNEVFPDNCWSDLIVAVLAHWTDCALRIANGTSNKEGLRFMDGPYGIICTRQDIEAGLRCMKFTDIGAQVILEGTIPSREFTRQIRDSSQLVLRACEARGFASKDLEVLRSAVESLDQVIQ